MEKRSGCFLVVLICGLLLWFPLVLADNEPNNGQNNAEKLESGGSSTGSLGDPSADMEDWYYVELPAFAKVTVTITLTSDQGEIWVYEIFEDESEGGEYININVHPDYRTGDDSYQSDDMKEINLYFRVAGDGEYTIKAEISGGNACCGGLFALGLIPLLVLVGGLILYRRAV